MLQQHSPCESRLLAALPTGDIEPPISQLELVQMGIGDIVDLDALDTADRTLAPAELQFKSNHLQEKLKTMRQQMRRMRRIEWRLKDERDGQLSLTDPDARSMATSGRGSGIVGYNVLTAVDGRPTG